MGQVSFIARVVISRARIVHGRGGIVGCYVQSTTCRGGSVRGAG